MANKFDSNSVKELQTFLKDRGVIFSNQKKIELIELCLAADELGLDIDPDGLIEDREEILRDKLLLHSGSMIKNPVIVSSNGNKNLSILPQISIIDIFNYLVQFRETYSYAILRDYKKTEGYSLYEDGYVLDVETQLCLNSEDNEEDGYFSVISKVKPRTNEKDPITKKPYYVSWIIFSAQEDASRIYSAYCGCKGGLDGSCRHVLATLFETMNYIDDFAKTSVTSGPCQWVRRATTNLEPLLATDLQTGHATIHQHVYPHEDIYDPMPRENTLPSVESFMETVKQHLPSACILDSMFIKEQNDTVSYDTLNLPSPMDYITLFFSQHKCDSADCSELCLNELKLYLAYSSDQITKIENGTRGQHHNQNWHSFREGILTASKFHEAIHCRDTVQKACKFLQPSTLNDKNLPAPIKFGRSYEEKARVMFVSSHKYHHRKTSCSVPGLILSNENPFLGASPDGIVSCPECGIFLIEIKCIYSCRNFFPKNALLVSKICEKNDSGELTISKTHKYYYQIQGQLAITNINKCFLVGYTHKGIHSVPVEFDQDFWDENEKLLTDFYKTGIYPCLRAQF